MKKSFFLGQFYLCFLGGENDLYDILFYSSLLVCLSMLWKGEFLLISLGEKSLKNIHNQSSYLVLKFDQKKGDSFFAQKSAFFSELSIIIKQFSSSKNLNSLRRHSSPRYRRSRFQAQKGLVTCTTLAGLQLQDWSGRRHCTQIQLTI